MEALKPPIHRKNTQIYYGAVYENNRKMNRNNHGFTILEIVVVLVLISVIAAAVFTRSITTDQINFVGQVDKIQSHIRYARSLAMKHGQADNSERWGIFCTADYYWLFHWKQGGDEGTPIKFPGEENDIITLSDLGLNMSFFLLYFDKFGKPYEMNDLNYLVDELKINVSAAADASQKKIIAITPETGLVRKIDE